MMMMTMCGSLKAGSSVFLFLVVENNANHLMSDQRFIIFTSYVSVSSKRYHPPGQQGAFDQIVKTKFTLKIILHK